MICSWMLYCKYCLSVRESVRYFAKKRTNKDLSNKIEVELNGKTQIEDSKEGVQKVSGKEIYIIKRKKSVKIFGLFRCIFIKQERI